MATKPLHRYTVAEAGNLKVYEDYKSQEINCAADNTYVESTDWVDNPAKSITIIPYTGDAAGVITFNLKIKGSYGDDIVVLFDDFPITIDNLLIDRIKMKTADSSTDEIFKILSFH
tara:strand:+ start:5232 stop:5579 length:348 start_codon:yes stop_codon:yes gene_type:complete